MILNIQIADTYMFFPQAIYFLTSLKEQEFFISSDIEVFFNCHYKYFYIKIKPFNWRYHIRFKIFSLSKSGIVCALKLEFETALVAFFSIFLIFMIFFILRSTPTCYSEFHVTFEKCIQQYQMLSLGQEIFL